MMVIAAVSAAIIGTMQTLTTKMHHKSMASSLKPKLWKPTKNRKVPSAMITAMNAR
jgi:hypothetical protein